MYDPRSMGSTLMGQFDSNGPKWFEQWSRCSDKLACSGNYTLYGGQKKRIGGYEYEVQ